MASINGSNMGHWPRPKGRNVLKIDYEIVKDAPKPWSWDEYNSWLCVEWPKLLASEDAKDESRLQAFLEQHPCLVPGAFSFPPSGHTPFPGVLISQPRLQGVGLKVPDFMWIAFDSLTVYPILIEIETPGKRWFTESGVMHSDFTSAYNQLHQWAAWLNNPVNQQVFVQTFMIPYSRILDRRFQPQFVLVHGNRSEIDRRPELNSMRAQYNTADFKVMTFDRMHPLANSSSFGSAKLDCGQYRAIAFPPTFQLGPHVSGNFALLRGREEAISSNQLMSAERKQFLLGRIAYWDAHQHPRVTTLDCSE